STPFFASEAATSASVRNSLPAFAAERSRGTSYMTNQVPWRSGSPQGVRRDGAAFVAALDLELVAGVWAAKDATRTMPIHNVFTSDEDSTADKVGQRAYDRWRPLPLHY